MTLDKQLTLINGNIFTSMQKDILIVDWLLCFLNAALVFKIAYSRDAMKMFRYATRQY